MSTVAYLDWGLNENQDDGIFIDLYPVWIDGELVPESVDSSTALLVGEDIHKWSKNREPILGANGFIARYGEDMRFEGDELVKAEVSRYSAFNANTGKCIHMEDPFPNDDERKIVLSNVDPLMAVSYGDGALCLFDLANENYTMLLSYAPGEVLSIGFSADDKLLTVLKIDGRLDIFDMATRTLSGSVYSPLVHSRIREYGNTWKKELEVAFLNEDTLCVSIFWNNEWVRLCVLIDTSTQTIISEVSDVLMVDYDRLYMYAISNGALYRYPIYTTDDLIAWAKEEIGAEQN